ncbi:MAG: NnrU family protein [Alphaproteobacteria bacterium]
MIGPLAAAALFWIVLHLGVAGSPLRGMLLAKLGAGPYRGLFALTSAIGLTALGVTYRYAAGPVLWDLGQGARWATLFLMLPTLLLFVGSVTGANPTAVGGERLLAREDAATGIFRVTRHPMLWAFSLWAIGHLLVRGAVPDLLLFGSILLTTLAGMASIDRKRTRAAPEEWRRYAAATSLLPFAAILGGRNRFVWKEIAGWRLLLAIVAWAALVALHPIVFGLPALPG